MPLTPKSGGTLKSGRKPIRSIQTGTDILRNVRSSRNSESTAMKPGLNRREHRLRSRGALQRLEPDEGKLSRPVLRGGSSGNAAPLPDYRSDSRTPDIALAKMSAFSLKKPPRIAKCSRK